MLKYEVPWKVIGWSGAAVTGVVGYQYLSLNEGSDNSLREGQAAQLARVVSLDLPALPGRPKIAVAAFQNDPQGFLQTHLKEWINRRNVQLVEPGLLDRAASLVTGSQSESQDAEIQRAVRTTTADYVLSGDVKEWVTWPVEESHLSSQVQLVEVSTGRAIFDRLVRVPESKQPGDAGSPTPAQSIPGATPAARVTYDPVLEFFSDPFIAGLTIWLLVVLLTAWLLAESLGQVLKKESNAANASLILCFVLLSAGIAWIAWGRTLELPSVWLVVLLAALMTVPYFGMVCAQVDRARK